MNRQHFTLAGCVLGATLAMASLATQAQSMTILSPEQQYQEDLKKCEQDKGVVDVQACKREAGAALQAAKQDKLGNGGATNYQDNQRSRCMALPAKDRDDCLMQMSGQNTTVQGSVKSGGVLRETTITVPAAPATK
jgi:curli biogenesis system outer membrane secretion channel CsgG